MTLRIRLWAILWPVLLGLTGLGTWVIATSDHDSGHVSFAIAYCLIALSFAVTGLIAWTLRPDNGTGRLMIWVDLFWILNALNDANSGWVIGPVGLIGSMFLAAFLHLIVAFPEGRLGSRLERRAVLGMYGIAFLAGALPNLFAKRFSDCKNCPANPILIADEPGLSNAFEAVFTVAGVIVFAGLVVLLVRRWHAASAAQRRILGPVYLSGGVTVALIAALFATSSFSAAQRVFGVVAFLTFGTIPLFFLWGLLRTRLRRAAAQLLREVPNDPTPAEIEEGFRHVLGDPTLCFVTWVDEANSYIDPQGNRCQLSPLPAGRMATEIGYEDVRLGAIIHDAALRHQQALIDEVVSAARLAMMKDRGLQALRLSEARSRALLDAIPDLMFRMARDGTYLEAAGRRESLVRPREELIGHSVRELLPGEIADRFEEALARPASSGVQTVDYQLEINGELRDFEARMVPSGNDEMVVIVRDFTDRTRLEEELSRRLERLQREQAFTRAVVDLAPVIFLLIDTEGRVVRFNASAEELFGITDDENVRGKPWWDVFLPAESRAEAQRLCRRMKEGAAALHGQSDWLAADGRRIVVSAEVRRVVDGDGVLRFLICGQDLTELVAQREEIEAHRDFLTAVSRATPSLLIAVDRDGTIAPEGVNYAFRQLMGYADRDAIGKKFWDLVCSPELIDEVREAFREQVEAGHGLEHETAWIGRSGEWRIISWWLRPLGEDSDKFIVCGTDVTLAREQEAELRASRSRIVEAGDDARRRLERNLHDGAQQRLVSLSLAIRLAQAKLKEDPVGADEILSAAGEELTQALAELRELARGIHPAVLTDRGLAPALEALASRAPLPVTLSTEMDERLPGPVEAAAYYVVAEALTNVAKYADASAVEVRALRDNGRVLVEVADDGVGGADPAAGTGLRGLADRVEALDGTLEVESAAGSGTTVRAVIPLGRS